MKAIIRKDLSSFTYLDMLQVTRPFLEFNAKMYINYVVYLQFICTICLNILPTRVIWSRGQNQNNSLIIYIKSNLGHATNPSENLPICTYSCSLHIPSTTQTKDILTITFNAENTSGSVHKMWMSCIVFGLYS